MKNYRFVAIIYRWTRDYKHKDEMRIIGDRLSGIMKTIQEQKMNNDLIKYTGWEIETIIDNEEIKNTEQSG